MRVWGVLVHFQGYVEHFGLASFHPMVYLLTAFFYNFLALFRGSRYFCLVFFQQFSSIFYKFLFSPAMISSFFQSFHVTVYRVFKKQFVSSSTLDFRTPYVRSFAVVCLLRFSASHRCFTLGSNYF